MVVLVRDGARASVGRSTQGAGAVRPAAAAHRDEEGESGMAAGVGEDRVAYARRMAALLDEWNREGAEGGQVVDAQRRYRWSVDMGRRPAGVVLEELGQGEESERRYTTSAAMVAGGRLHVEELVPLPGYICEGCLDAPAVGWQGAPWGGEMAVCAGCWGRGGR